MRKYNIPVFVAHRGCPFDCVFCNQNRITGTGGNVTPDNVTETAERCLSTIPIGSDVELAFFGGSFTGIPTEEQNALMDRVRPYIESGRIRGIRLSTRPDYIDETILENLAAHGVTAIELGVQSMNDEVLRKSHRGHTAEQARVASKLIKEYGFELGLQMMTGLPGDTPERSERTATEIIALKPECARIYPTLVIKDTYLEKLYQEGKYRPQTLEEATRLAKKLLLMFEDAGIRVIRVGLQPTDEISENASVVAGPFHSAFREVVESGIYHDIIVGSINPDCKNADVYVNPKEISKAVGCRKNNIIEINNRFGVKIKVKGDESLAKREVRCVCF